MTDVELERRLADWYRSEIPAAETAPPGLRSSVMTIPLASAASSRRFATRRGFIVLAAAALGGLLAGTAVVAGLLPPRPASAVGKIVFVRDGDLFIAEIDGSGQTRIATGDADGAKLGYLTAAWSPDMRHIAAVRDVGGAYLTPGVDLMTADGALVRTVALDAGCGPSLSWSPDSSEVAIATCPADVPRDAVEPVESGIRLLLAGLDASADQEVALPPEWRSVASARREVWIRPDLWARWSPDGRWIALPAIVVAGQSFAWQMVAVDGSGTRRVEGFIDGVGGNVESLDWSRDGRRLAVSGGIGCVETVCLGIVDFERGHLTATAMHPSNAEPNMHGKLFWPEFSPDGDRVAVLGGLIDFTLEPTVAETYTLYDYDLATARFTELTSGNRPMILDATGAAQPTGTMTGERVEGATVAWTPDGRGLLYLVRDAGDSAASWTIRSIDAAGGSQSSILVRGVQSFDFGWPRP